MKTLHRTYRSVIIILLKDKKRENLTIYLLIDCKRGCGETLQEKYYMKESTNRTQVKQEGKYDKTYYILWERKHYEENYYEKESTIRKKVLIIKRKFLWES